MKSRGIPWHSTKPLPTRRSAFHARIGPSVHGGSRGEAYAALDLGTNNCRLLIAEPSRAGFRVVDAFSRIVRLGEGAGQFPLP